MLSIKHLLVRLLAFVLLVHAAYAAAEEYVFSAPPRGTAAKEAAVYQPIAAYLSQVTDKKIVYQHPDNWLNYQNKMQKGAYDLVFDGPHFVSWRMTKTEHEPLVRLPGKLAFVIAVRKSDAVIDKVEQLKGQTVCALAPPNLATLTLLKQFDNPVRQPILVNSKSFPQSYDRMIKGNCTASVMRDKMFNKLNKENKLARVIYHSEGIANQAFSAGPKFTAEDKQKISAALLSPEGKQKMDKFHARFNKQGKPLEPATRDEYKDLAILLKDVWGFELATVQ